MRQTDTLGSPNACLYGESHTSVRTRTCTTHRGGGGPFSRQVAGREAILSLLGGPRGLGISQIAEQIVQHKVAAFLYRQEEGLHEVALDLALQAPAVDSAMLELRLSTLESVVQNRWRCSLSQRKAPRPASLYSSAHEDCTRCGAGVLSVLRCFGKQDCAGKQADVLANAGRRYLILEGSTAIKKMRSVHGSRSLKQQKSLNRSQRRHLVLQSTRDLHDHALPQRILAVHGEEVNVCIVEAQGHDTLMYVLQQQPS